MDLKAEALISAGGWPYDGENVKTKMSDNETNHDKLAAAETAEKLAFINVFAYCYVLPFICLFGIVGNVANLVTLASRRLKAVSYMYLRALAVADLSCMLFVLLFCASEIMKQFGSPLRHQLWFAWYQAHIMLSLINWSVTGGVLIVVALTLDRFISVVFPIYFRTYNIPRRAAAAISVCFGITTLFYVPYAMLRYQTDEWDDETDNLTVYKLGEGAYFNTTEWNVYKWSREGIVRFLPIITLCLLNAGIIIAFRKRQRFREKLRAKPNPVKHTPSLGGQTSNSSQAVQQRDDALLYLLFGIVVVFFVCNVPAAINLLIIREDLKNNLAFNRFRACANLLEIFNHATNFYVFCLCSADYRMTLLEKFPCIHVVWRGVVRVTTCVRKTLLGRADSLRGEGVAALPPADSSSSELTALNKPNQRMQRTTVTEDGMPSAVVVHKRLLPSSEQQLNSPNYRSCQTVLKADQDLVKTIALINDTNDGDPPMIDADDDDNEPLMTTL